MGFPQLARQSVQDDSQFFGAEQAFLRHFKNQRYGFAGTLPNSDLYRMSLSVTILGCGAATPAATVNPSAQVVEVNGRLVLIDCGEGTQVQLRRNKIKFTRIQVVCISHMHGDHVFGLPGLLSTFHLLGRREPLVLVGPPALEEWVRTTLKTSGTWTCYPLHFVSTDSEPLRRVFSDEQLSIFTFPLRHSLPTTGFKIEAQVGLRGLRSDALTAWKVPACDYRTLQLGRDWTNEDGVVVPNAELTREPARPLSYAYASDTAYLQELPAWIQGVDALYHESTFAEEHRVLAQKTLHSTAADAAKIAAEAGVGQLLLGHFSIRYRDRGVLLREALPVFGQTLLAEEGKTYRWMRKK